MKLTPTQASLLAGASTIFSMYPAPVVVHYTRTILPMYQPPASALEALRGDWMKVGADIAAVLASEDLRSELLKQRNGEESA